MRQRVLRKYVRRNGQILDSIVDSIGLPAEFVKNAGAGVGKEDEGSCNPRKDEKGDSFEGSCFEFHAELGLRRGRGNDLFPLRPGFVVVARGGGGGGEKVGGQ